MCLKCPVESDLDVLVAFTQCPPGCLLALTVPDPRGSQSPALQFPCELGILLLMRSLQQRLDEFRIRGFSYTLLLLAIKNHANKTQNKATRIVLDTRFTCLLQEK